MLKLEVFSFLIFWIKTCCAVKYLTPSETYSYVSSQRFDSFEPDLQIYCYIGHRQSLASAFQSVKFELFIDNDDYVQYEGDSPQMVQKQYENQRSIFSFNVLNTSNKKIIKINPFNQTCIGIETAHKYSVRLNLLRLDFSKIILLCCGFFVFVYAQKLSQTPLFYYLSGILLGIFASFLVVIYFSSKMFPKKIMAYGMIAGGWTLGIYFIQILWENLHIILVSYQGYVFWYTVITGFISFVICYRMGPPKNPRSKEIIKWGLQIIASILIFYSSSYREASVFIIISVTFWCYFPISAVRLLKRFWIKRFPPKPRLLSNDEYYEQGVRETTKALEDLKNFCNSPESKPWKMMTRLKDPQRFASFIEGSSHLEDDEILDYETSQINDEDIATDDNDDSDINL